MSGHCEGALYRGGYSGGYRTGRTRRECGRPTGVWDTVPEGYGTPRVQAYPPTGPQNTTPSYPSYTVLYIKILGETERGKGKTEGDAGRGARRGRAHPL